MAQQPQSNPFKEFENLMEYLGGVNTDLEKQKATKEGYEKLLQSYVASLRVGNFDLQFYAVVHTLAKETNRLYAEENSKKWVKGAIGTSPWIYDNISATLKLYQLLFTQRKQLLDSENKELDSVVQAYDTTLQEAKH